MKITAHYLSALALALLLATLPAVAQPGPRRATYLPLVARFERPGAWLAGAWRNELAVYTFDLVALTQTRAIGGLVEVRPMTILDESDQRVIYRTTGEPITASRLSNTSLGLSQPGRLPQILTR